MRMLLYEQPAQKLRKSYFITLLARFTLLTLIHVKWPKWWIGRCYIIGHCSIILLEVRCRSFAVSANTDWRNIKTLEWVCLCAELVQIRWIKATDPPSPHCVSSVGAASAWFVHSEGDPSPAEPPQYQVSPSLWTSVTFNVANPDVSM